MARHHLARLCFRIAILGIAALGGVQECVALLRARLSTVHPPSTPQF